MLLTWHTVTESTHPSFLTKGTELSVAICGHHCRYQICEVRSYRDGFADRTYLIRDAETVTLDEVMNEDIRPRVVYRTDDIDKAISYCFHDKLN